MALNLEAEGVVVSTEFQVGVEEKEDMRRKRGMRDGVCGRDR